MSQTDSSNVRIYDPWTDTTFKSFLCPTLSNRPTWVIFEINNEKLTDILFVDDKGNNAVKCSEKEIEDFRFGGLNNTDFITSGFYLTGWDKENKL